MARFRGGPGAGPLGLIGPGRRGAHGPERFPIGMDGPPDPNDQDRFLTSIHGQGPGFFHRPRPGSP